MRTPHTWPAAVSEYGVGTGDVRVDMAKVKARKDKVMLDDRHGVESWLQGMEGCTLLYGHARFEPRRTPCGSTTGSCRGSGSFSMSAAVPWCPTLPGLADIDYLTNVSIMELDTVPEHLVVIGGSYIGLEFAQMYRRFGAEVTVIERGPRLASREDADVSAAIRDILENEGVDVIVDATQYRFHQARQRFRGHYSTGGGAGGRFAPVGGRRPAAQHR